MSVFSEVQPAERIAENALAFAIFDKFPMAPGHALVVSKREIASWFDASLDERKAILELADHVWAQIGRRYSPKGCRLMVNIGSCQHIRHLHVHLIPSYSDHP